MAWPHRSVGAPGAPDTMTTTLPPTTHSPTHPHGHYPNSLKICSYCYSPQICDNLTHWRIQTDDDVIINYFEAAGGDASVEDMCGACTNDAGVFVTADVSIPHAAP